MSHVVGFTRSTKAQAAFSASSLLRAYPWLFSKDDLTFQSFSAGKGRKWRGGRERVLKGVISFGLRTETRVSY